MYEHLWLYLNYVKCGVLMAPYMQPPLHLFIAPKFKT